MKSIEVQIKALSNSIADINAKVIAQQATLQAALNKLEGRGFQVPAPQTANAANLNDIKRKITEAHSRIDILATDLVKITSELNERLKAVEAFVANPDTHRLTLAKLIKIAKALNLE
jgi:chaperonin cofactor prefoldin